MTSGRRVRAALGTVHTRVTRVRFHWCRFGGFSRGDGCPCSHRRCALPYPVNLLAILRRFQSSRRGHVVIRRHGAACTKPFRNIALRCLARWRYCSPRFARWRVLQICSAPARACIAGRIHRAIIVSCTAPAGVVVLMLRPVMNDLRIVSAMYNYRCTPVRMINGMCIHNPWRGTYGVVSVIRSPIGVVIIVVYRPPGSPPMRTVVPSPMRHPYSIVGTIYELYNRP